MTKLSQSLPHHKASVLLRQAASNLLEIRRLGIFPAHTSEVIRSARTVERLLEIYQADAAAGLHRGGDDDLGLDEADIPPVVRLNPWIVPLIQAQYPDVRPLVAEAVVE